MKRMLAIVSAFAASVAFADPATYYVDERGDDSWDGTASYDDRDESVTPVKGPKKTLKAAAARVTATSSADEVGDTIYIYPGDYRNADSTPYFCAVLPAGCRLIGVGDKSAIRIHGSGTSWSDRESEVTSTASGMKRCLSLGNWTLVKGVTLRDGRHNDNGGCCSGGTDGFIVDCILTENYIKAADPRGGAISAGVTPIRCLFLRNGNSSNKGSAMNKGVAWNCVFDQDDVTGCYAVYQTTTYNCTYVGGSGSNYNGYMTNCLCKVKVSGAKYGSDSIINSSLQLDSEYVPLEGSAAVDRGDTAAYLELFPASQLVADQKNLDFNGRKRVVNGKIDAGAAESQSITATVNVNDANGGLVVSGIEPGVATVIDPGVTSVTISRNNSTVKHCEGIEVNGEFFSFTGESADLVYTHVFDGTASETLNVTAVYSSANQWYVATTGNDANAGDAPYRAKRTLAGAMGIANLAANDVVHVAEGTYDSREMWDGTCSNRLYVTKAVGIVADGARERTIIMGKGDEAAAAEERGCTISSVRCVHLGARSAYIKGFTITGGHSITNGGGVNSSASRPAHTAVIDCIITNNVINNTTGAGHDGGGVFNTTCIGCYLDDNYKDGKGSGIGGSAGKQSSYINSHIAGGNIYTSSIILNSRIDYAAHTSDSATKEYDNCVILKPGFQGEFMNCLHVDDGIDGLAAMFDENLSPKYGTLPVDNADAYTIYTNKFPDTWARFKDVCYGGGQRVYNGKLDIGPGEYDWRGEFAKCLKGRNLSVAEATANVTTNAISGVTLLDGDSIAIDWMLQREGEYAFNVAVSGAGEASVTIDGEAASVLGGVCSFTVGEGETGLTKRIVVSFAGEGSATVSGFSSSKTGLMLLIQ